MSLQCLKCNEAWDFDDYVCPCCDGATVDAESNMTPTLRYEFYDSQGNKESPYANGDSYDVIRIETGKSIFDEPGNFMNAA